MPLPLPNLDDRSYADLVAEAMALIPVEAPEWTDHNPADTGIVLIELLAWLTEMVLYRVNQIPDANQAAFLTLLKGGAWALPPGASQTECDAILQAEIQKTLVQLRRPYRAVTIKDFEQLVLVDWMKTRTAQTVFGAAGEIARVHCLPERDLEHFEIDHVIEAHITVVVLPRIASDNTEALRKTLKRFLNQRRLITSRLHVVEPSYIKVTIAATLYLYDSANFKTVQAEATRRIQSFFAPQDSQEYWEGQGYPFGASIYISEIYQLLDNIPGVDYVEDVTLSHFDEFRQQFNEQNQLIGLLTYEHELVSVEVDRISTLQRFGEQWKLNP
jgi:hypothetical protein